MKPSPKQTKITKLNGCRYQNWLQHFFNSKATKFSFTKISYRCRVTITRQIVNLRLITLEGRLFVVLESICSSISTSPTSSTSCFGFSTDGAENFETYRTKSKKRKKPNQSHTSTKLRLIRHHSCMQQNKTLEIHENKEA